MTGKVHQLRPGNPLGSRGRGQQRDHQGFFCVLGGNLLVPVLASQGLDQEGMVGRLGGYAILLCLTGLILQGLTFMLGRVRLAMRQDTEHLADLDAWSRLADRGAFIELLSRFSVVLAGGLLAAAVLACATMLLWPVVVGAAVP